MYCVVPTTDRCDTIFLNGVEAYKDLPNDVKDKIKNSMLMITNDLRSFHRSDFPHLITRTEQHRILNANRAYTISEDQVTPEEAQDLHNIQGRNRGKGPIYKEMMRRKEEFSIEGARWKYVYKKLVPLGGITSKNINELKVINCEGFALLSEIKKKPANIINRLF